MPGILQWGIIGLGGIAGVFAHGLEKSTTGKLLAVASRTQQKADEFAAKSHVPRAYGSYQALLDDSDVDVVYIATPHTLHAEWAIRAAEAGKHILCEKPLTLNHAEAVTVIEAARRHDVFLMEAFMYRCHPQTAKLVELLHDRVIGDVRAIRAVISSGRRFDPDVYAFNKDLGGGGILDMGCYVTSMARLVAGAAVGQDFAEPIEVKGCAHLGKTGVDEWAIASLRFPGDILAQIAVSISLAQDNVVQIFGSEGSIVIPLAWGARKAQFIIQHEGQQEPQEILIETEKGKYTLEADTVAMYLDKRQAPSPSMTWDDTLGNMKTLDRWREAVGMVYESEKSPKA